MFVKALKSLNSELELLGREAYNAYSKVALEIVTVATGTGTNNQEIRHVSKVKELKIVGIFYSLILRIIGH